MLTQENIDKMNKSKKSKNQKWLYK
jgi:hypothetical protein